MSAPLAAESSHRSPTTVITAGRPWFDWRLGELWRYRELVTLFVWRDFVSVYKQTILGPTWHIIRPLFTTVIYTVVFGQIAGIPTDGAPQFLFFMVGNVAWMYFANTLSNTASTLVSNAGLLGKVYFHRLVIPVSLVFSNLISFGIQFGILIVVMIGYRATGHELHPTAWMAAIPFLLFMLAGFSLGAGIIICAMTTRYRDLTYLVTFGVQSLMYLTPVIFPVSAVPERYRWIVALNPLTPVFEAFRYGLLGAGSVSVAQLGISVVVMVALVIIGLLAFTRVERTFLDTV